MSDKYAVTYKGKVITRLNERLASRQKITDEQLEALKVSHQVRYIIFERAKKTKDSRKLKELAALLEELEFLQQGLWNFPQDRNFHRWFDLPNCLCPKMDNEDALGVDHRTTRLDCPAHGNPKLAKKIEQAGRNG